MNEHKVKSNLRSAISDFCRWRVNQCLCDDGDCVSCPVNETYDLARETEDTENDDIE